MQQGSIELRKYKNDNNICRIVPNGSKDRAKRNGGYSNDHTCIDNETSIKRSPY